MFREVRLPPAVTGRLLLHSMPGRREPLDSVWAAVKSNRVAAIVRLVDLDDIRTKSPAYADAIATRSVPCEMIDCEIPDFGVPDDLAAFERCALSVAERIRDGDALLVHCWAGIGRTGTFAVCVLVALGEPVDDALDSVSAAGSGPETGPQAELVDWFAARDRARVPVDVRKETIGSWMHRSSS